MKIHRYHSLLFFLLVLILVVVVSSFNKTSFGRPGIDSSKSADLLRTDQFYDEELFAKGELDKESWIVDQNVKGAIIPHHGLAGRYLSSFFSSIKDKNINTVILMGPNHDRVGDKMIYTSSASRKTEFGIVYSDVNFVKDLVVQDNIAINDDIVSTDHSIGTILPYIAKYMTPARVIPLLINETNLVNIDSVAEVIADQLGDSVIVIAAVDFSHDLTVGEAIARDRQTLGYILNKDYQNILRLGNDHLDAPTTIILLDKIMEKVGHGEFTVLKMSNSYEITGNPNQITSYIIGVY